MAYRGYNYENDENKSGIEIYKMPENIEVVRNLPEPVLSENSLLKLADFLEAEKSDYNFPEISVIPNVLKSVGRFVNERKKMKYAHKEFEQKISFLSEGIDKQYNIELRKLESENEMTVAQLKVQVLSMNRYYDLLLEELRNQYKLKKEDMNRYYNVIKAQREEEKRRFDKMIEIAMINRKDANKAIEEAEEICAHFRNKLYNNTITREEREHYMELLKFRLNGIQTIENIIPQLAAKIK